MKEIKSVLLPVKSLMPYREFDRVKQPAPVVAFAHESTVEEVREDITVTGLKESLTFCYDPKHNMGLLTDGNHRIAALDQLEREYVRVDIRVYENMGEIVNDHHGHTVRAFKYVGEDLRNILESLI